MKKCSGAISSQAFSCKTGYNLAVFKACRLNAMQAHSILNNKEA